MNSNLPIAVIGGTGKSGKYLVSKLIRQQISIRLLLRNPGNFYIKSPLVSTVLGDVRNYASVHAFTQGCKAVISTLGQPKNESTIFSQATKNIIKAMDEHHCKRYIVTTGLSVDTPFDKKNQQTQFATDWMKNNYPETTFDKQVEYTALTESNIDWTLVRLPLIDLTDVTGKINLSTENCPGDKIGAANLAQFLIDQLTDDTYLMKAPFIANE